MIDELTLLRSQVVYLKTETNHWMQAAKAEMERRIQAERALVVANEMADQVDRITNPKRESELANATDEYGLLLSLVLKYQLAREGEVDTKPPAVSQEDVALVDKVLGFEPTLHTPEWSAIIAAWQRIKQSLATHPKIPGET